MDATVLPQARARDVDVRQEPSAVLAPSEDSARVLLLSLKQQLAEFDNKKPKSRFRPRRAGRMPQSDQRPCNLTDPGSV
jgi:hypothetical protein